MKHSVDTSCFSNFTHQQDTEIQELLPADIAKTIPSVESAENDPNPKAIVHLHNEGATWDWYILGYDPYSKIAYGFVSGFVPKYDRFSIEKFEETNRNWGKNVYLRDEDFEPTPIDQIEDECIPKSHLKIYKIESL